MPNLPIALVPGHVGAQSKEELRRNILEVTLDRVVESLMGAPGASSEKVEPDARDIIFKGSFEEVNSYFYENELSDGLPIVPPTREKIEAFLRYTDNDPDEVLGIVLPDGRAATIWNVAVNGVMAGCRPEYMPILVALAEAMVDPDYGIRHCGNTGGSDTLIILNGPIIKQLHFNYTQGVLRDGILPNTTVGRFWRLYMRNVAGFLHHKNDKATFGNTWRVVGAENEDVLNKIGWEPNSVEMGFCAGDNTVTIGRYSGGNAHSSFSGSTPLELLPYLADATVKQVTWQLTQLMGVRGGALRPLILLSPILAETIAKAGWSKSDVKRYLFDHARIPAWQFERMLRDWTARHFWNLADEVRLGRIPKVFYESDDPNRMVPIVWEPEDYMIAVMGDPLRANAYVFSSNGAHGYPVGKKIRLSKTWERWLAGAGE